MFGDMHFVIFQISALYWLCVLPSRAFISVPNSFSSSTGANLKIEPDESTFTFSIQGRPGRLEQEQGSSKRALLALYGLQNRDHGCAWTSHLHLREALESMGYTVDMFVYEIGPDSKRVDGVPWSSGSLQDKLHDNRFYHWENMSDVDAHIQQKCGSKLHLCAQTRTPHDPVSTDPRYQYARVLYALRQLHAENRVAHFLDSGMGHNYELVVAVASDIVVLQNISRNDAIDLSMVPEKTLFVSGDGNFGGVTNGLYMGSAEVVRSVMGRWNFPASGNYEEWLGKACRDAGVVVRQLEGHSKGHSFLKVRHDGCLKKRAPWSGPELRWKPIVTSCLAKYVVKHSDMATRRERAARWMDESWEMDDSSWMDDCSWMDD